MGNPARKFSKGRTSRRRAINFRATMPKLSSCPQCHEPKVSHRVCMKCGYYDGKEIIDTSKEKSK
ncbi:MAG: 50S ribosomal protein L32 [Oscillospiraceae bacterium]|nr:50S ribosomal protein L32 [Oscillospiraceae bacterium]